MKRILVLLLTSPCFIFTTPEYRVNAMLVKNFGSDASTYRVQLDESLIFKVTSISRGYQYQLNMKLLSVLNNKATFEYLMNRNQPNPTAHTDFNNIEIDTDSRQKIACLDDDDAELWVKIESTPTESSSCIIL